MDFAFRERNEEKPAADRDWLLSKGLGFYGKAKVEGEII
jgi:hypothetical protein